MPRRTDIKKILIIGAGPIIIGQACEFDYSGTQACKALREEGYEIVLVNSNPATIMTDPETADRTYIEPITPEHICAILRKERPDAVLPTLGGQTALNAALQVAETGILEELGIEMIGADRDVIKRAEDRDLFRETMRNAGIDLPKSELARNRNEAYAALEIIGLPCVIRPAFTLGGTGGGIAYNKEEFEKIANGGLAASMVNEVLIEECLAGWKEFEMEMMRDKNDNVVVVCSIENFDPMGVHTGDSITVAPVQTMTDREYQKMRDDSLKIIRAVGVETGGCNIQFAQNPKTGRLVVIEMNPRVSRSSALASKATGFPIAKIAAKVAVGYTLDELRNDITQTTSVCFEPTIDYCVVKIPRFAFEKFPEGNETLSIQMKSVGEAMGIGRTFKEALHKTIRSMENRRFGLFSADDDTEPLDELYRKVGVPTRDRLYQLASAFRQGGDIDTLYRLTGIDPWFLEHIAELVQTEVALENRRLDDLTKEEMLRLKRLGFSDRRLAEILNSTEKWVRTQRLEFGITAVRKMVDTCGAEFAAVTPYYYTTYGEEDEGTSSEQCAESEAENEKKFPEDLTTLKARIRKKFDDFAVPFPNIPYSDEAFFKLFGKEKTVDTPLGKVKIGDHQFEKLAANSRENLLGAMKETLADPVVILKENRNGKEALLFIKSYVQKDGSSFLLVMSVVIENGETKITISTHQRKEEQIYKKIEDTAVIVWEKPMATVPAPFGYDVNSSSSPQTYSQENDTERGILSSESANLSTRKQADGKKSSVLILGGGPNRIGQGIEFDYCCCHAAYTVKKSGYRAIMMNCNPETVSTDYDTSDVLYFEPLTLEDVLAVIAHEKPMGVVLQFGGQTPLNLAKALAEEGVSILGTDVAAIALAEDRRLFGEMLQELDIRQTAGTTAIELDDALTAAEKIGYPVLMRPSFVLGGAKMEIIFDREDLKSYWNALLVYSRQADLIIDKNRPILIDRFLEDAVEIDVDAVADGETVIVAAIMEHIEEAGIHSGDSACSLPPISLTPKLIRQLEGATRKIALKMNVIGLLNIQFAIKNNLVYVLEVNPRASRTIPFVSKAIGEPMAAIATRVMLGEKLPEMFLAKPFRRWQELNHIAVKESVFPWTRFPGVDTRLGPEMKSTGEVMGIAETFGEAFAKGESGTGVPIPLSGNVFVSVKESDKPLIGEIAKQLVNLGFQIIASRGTGDVLNSMGFKVETVSKIIEGERPNILDRMIDGKVQWIINTPSGKNPHRDEVLIRTTAMRLGVPLVTTIRGAKAFLEAIQFLRENPDVNVKAIQDYL